MESLEFHRSDFSLDRSILLESQLSQWSLGCIDIPFRLLSRPFRLSQRLVEEVIAEERKKPPFFIPIRRNEYVPKRPKRSREEEAHQCPCKAPAPGSASTVSEPICGPNCLCAILLMSCSSSCACQRDCNPSLQKCPNVAFQHRVPAKMKVVKTVDCGWGVVAMENIRAGSFVVEYVGEVIDDATCEQRLWDFKTKGETNFYMCEISREYVIDASYKGNIARFVNHSCDPNLELQKWEMDGETRIGLFALKNVPRGAPLTYDYQFVQFGEGKVCLCRSENCKGRLGSRNTKNLTIISKLSLRGKSNARGPRSSSAPRQTSEDLGVPPPILVPVPRKPRSAKRKFSRFPALTKKDSTSPDFAGPIAERNVAFAKRRSLACAMEDSRRAPPAWVAAAEEPKSNHDHHKPRQQGFCLGRRKKETEQETGETLVGRRVRIWWPLEQRYFGGMIVEYEAESDSHLVKYDDGDAELLNLRKEQWQLEVKTGAPLGPIALNREPVPVTRRDWSFYLGSKVRVWFSDRHRFRYGVICKIPLWYRPKAQVLYDDGEELELDMSQDRWEGLSKKQSTKVENHLSIPTIGT